MYTNRVVLQGSINEIEQTENIKILDFENSVKNGCIFENVKGYNGFPFMLGLTCTNDDTLNTTEINVNGEKKNYFLIIPPFSTGDISNNKVKFVKVQFNSYGHVPNLEKVKTFLETYNTYLKKHKKEGVLQKLQTATKWVIETATELNGEPLEQIKGLPFAAKGKFIENEKEYFKITRDSAKSYFDFMVTFFSKNNFIWMPTTTSKKDPDLYVTKEQIDESVDFIKEIAKKRTKEPVKIKATFIRNKGSRMNSIKGLNQDGNIYIEQKVKLL